MFRFPNFPLDDDEDADPRRRFDDSPLIVMFQKQTGNAGKVSFNGQASVKIWFIMSAKKFAKLSEYIETVCLALLTTFALDMVLTARLLVAHRLGLGQG